MEHEFWQEKWKEPKLGFDQAEPNASLVKHLDLFKGQKNVFIPLAGRSVDITYLIDNGHHVIANELVQFAVEDFFKKTEINYKITQTNYHQVYQGNGIYFYQGDVFKLNQNELEEVDWFYDRASLVALPPVLRQKYYQFLINNLPKNVNGLMVLFEYDQDKVAGPPHSVPEVELRRGLEPVFKVELLSKTKFEPNAPKFKESGVKVKKKTYFLSRE